MPFRQNLSVRKGRSSLSIGEQFLSSQEFYNKAEANG
jgi:hypothetical protein